MFYIKFTTFSSMRMPGLSVFFQVILRSTVSWDQTYFSSYLRYPPLKPSPLFLINIFHSHILINLVFQKLYILFKKERFKLLNIILQQNLELLKLLKLEFAFLV